MSTSKLRTTVLAGAVALAALVTADLGFATAGAQEEAEDDAEVTVELAPRNDSGIHGTARIHDVEEAEHEEAEEEEHAEAHEHGEKHGHRVVVELRGLETGASYPVHVHRGSCAEGGPVLMPLEAVDAGPDGTGSSTTTITAAQMAEKAKEMEGEHPPVYVQAHLPDGTPAACGDVPMEDEDTEGYGDR